MSVFTALPRKGASRAVLALGVLLAGSALVSPVLAQATAVPAEATIVLEPVVVSANRTPTPAREVGSAVTILDREELERRQVRFVSDALRTIPGVSVSRSGPTGQVTQVRLRGSESNQTLVLIDGIEVNDPSSASEFDFAHLLGRDVERIEVLRGPQSALYGSDAAGGVVNIVTRRGEGAPSVSGFIEGGSRETLSGGVSAGGGDERHDWFASLNGLRTEGFSAASEWRGNDERDGYENATGFVKFGFKAAEPLRFDFVGRAVDFETESDDFFGGVGATDGDVGTEGRQLFGRAQATLDLFEGRFRQVAGVTRTRLDLDYVTAGETDSTYRGEKTKFDYQGTVTARTEAVTPADHSFTFAAEHERDSALVDSPFFGFDREIEQTGFVGQYQLGLFESLYLTASVRHDSNELFGDETTYRFTGAYNIDETGTKLRASYGTGIKNPTLFELYGFSDTYRGNPELEAERAKGWDVGIDQALLGDLLLLEATYFDQRIEDLISGTGETSVNIDGTSPIHGVELGVSIFPLEGLNLRAAYTYTDAEDADGERLVRRPEHTASLDVGYVFYDERASVNLGIVYTGSRTDTGFDAFFTPYEVELDPYTLVNLAGSFKVHENAEVFGRVENLFDEEYEDVFTYGGTGRLAVAGFRVTF